MKTYQSDCNLENAFAFIVYVNIIMLYHDIEKKTWVDFRIALKPYIIPMSQNPGLTKCRAELEC